MLFYNWHRRLRRGRRQNHTKVLIAGATFARVANTTFTNLRHGHALYDKFNSTANDFRHRQGERVLLTKLAWQFRRQRPRVARNFVTEFNFPTASCTIHTVTRRLVGLFRYRTLPYLNHLYNTSGRNARRQAANAASTKGRHRANVLRGRASVFVYSDERFFRRFTGTSIRV